MDGSSKNHVLEMRIRNMFAAWPALMKPLALFCHDEDKMIPPYARKILVVQGYITTENVVPENVKLMIKSITAIKGENVVMAR